MIVTGGGRGIGAAVSWLAASHGYAVAVNYASDEGSAAELVDGIRGNGWRAAAIKGDVAREEDVIGLFEAAAHLGRPSVLVNNAGITGGFSRVDAVQAAMLERLFQVNVVGAFLCCREAIRRLSTRRGGSGGSIINISSRAAVLGSPGEWVHYAATKGAIDTLTVGLAREIAGEGIRVNAVAPGLIDTDIHAAAGAPDRATRLAESVPLGRAGLAEEVAEAVVWLASPAAAYVTGAILAVSGGR